MRFTIDDPYIEPCPATGCWLWLGTAGKYGHGKVRFRGIKTSAPRAFYQAKYGLLPKNIHLDHIVCKTPMCVNPDHLRAVTPRQNALENTGSIAAANRVKKVCPRCEGPYTTDKRGKRYCRPCAYRRTAQLQTERYRTDPVYRQRILDRNRAARASKLVAAARSASPPAGETTP